MQTWLSVSSFGKIGAILYPMFQISIPFGIQRNQHVQKRKEKKETKRKKMEMGETALSFMGEKGRRKGII